MNAGWKTIYDVTMVSKGIILLAQMATFNKDIREWTRKTTNLKTWANLKTFYTKVIVNKVEWLPPQEKKDTQWWYTIYRVYRHPLQKIITRR